MSIYARLMHLEEPAIPGHAFIAAVREVRLGNKTAQQAATIIGLSVAERQQVQDVIARVTGGFLTEDEFDRLVSLGSEPAWHWYADEAAFKSRLGVP